MEQSVAGKRTLILSKMFQGLRRSELHLPVRTGNSVSVFFLNSVSQLQSTQTTRRKHSLTRVFPTCVEAETDCCSTGGHESGSPGARKSP